MLSVQYSAKEIAPAFDTKETVIELNKVKIEAFPSHHLDSMRGLPNVSFILLDITRFYDAVHHVLSTQYHHSVCSKV
jgi:hypothetical protein